MTENQTRPVMKTQVENMEWRAGQWCYGVIVHEDLPTRLRAQKVWDELVTGMEGNIPCRLNYKSTADIKEQSDFGPTDLTNVVIVSVHDLPRFFLGTAVWLNEWLGFPSIVARTLFMLHDGEEDRRVIGMLRRITDSAGVTLVSIPFAEQTDSHLPPFGWTHFG
jgi:hypothetical protein